MKFDPPEFEGTLNPDLFIEWMQALESFFEIKECSDEKAFKVVFLSLKSMLPFGMRTLKNKGQRKANLGSELGSSLRNL